MILTTEEIDVIDQSMCGERECVLPFVRAIEQAIIAKLSQGVEPIAFVHFARKKPDVKVLSWQSVPSKININLGFVSEPLYEGDALAAARVKALEDAAVICESEYDNWDNERPLRLCVNEIRKLKGVNNE